jgi:hypothetical protein
LQTLFNSSSLPVALAYQKLPMPVNRRVDTLK